MTYDVFKIDGAYEAIRKAFEEKQKRIPKPRNPLVDIHDGCILFDGYIEPDGYGIFTFHSTKLNLYIHSKAHRASWMIYKGPIPTGKLVCHSCDRSFCVNHKHLYLGTHKTNRQDASNRRQTSDPLAKSWKLTRPQVEKIRHEYWNKCTSVPQLAKQFKVTKKTIHKVVSFKSHVYTT